LIREVPKVELHLHIEGTLEPELAMSLARRNGVDLGYADVESLRAAYEFTDLQSFLDIYYACCACLRTEEDFYDLTIAYLERVKADNVVHTEIFFDPQTHTVRGIPMSLIFAGIGRALEYGRNELGISSHLIMCFLRHLSEDEALQTLRDAEPFLDQIIGVGLDSGELGNPPAKFERVFAAARERGLRVVAHAGEEGPASFIRDALDLLQVERIDHGVACEQDDELIARLVADQVPLTVCPLSNVALRVVGDMSAHNLKRLLNRGICVTVNSDDPAYFGGYMNDNFMAVAEALDLSAGDLIRLANNAVHAAFVDDARQAELLALVAAVANA